MSSSRPTPSPLSLRRTVAPVLAILFAMVGTAPGVASAAPLAGSSTSQEQAACQASAVAARRTADIPHQVTGLVPIGGCVADNTGIERIYVDWAAEDDDARGRVCTDPGVSEAGAWRCEWDTTLLEPGLYVLEFTALDLAGNRGTFTRRYDVVAPDRLALPPAPPTTSPQEDARAPATAPPADHSEGAPRTGELEQPEASAPHAIDPYRSTTPPPALPLEPHPDDSGSAQMGSPATPSATDEFTEELAIAHIEACARNEVDDLPTASATVISQVEQADAVRRCLAPALEALGASVVELDVVPVPPAVRAVFDDPGLRDRLVEQLPASVAGVPLQLLTPRELLPALPSRPGEGAPINGLTNDDRSL